MPELLTRRKQAWVQQKKPALIRGGVLNNPDAQELRYRKKLEALINRMADTVEMELKKFFREPHAEEYFAQDASVSSQARILMNAVTRQFNDLFSTRAPDLADQAVTSADQASSLAVHTSLKELSGGLSLSTKALTGDLKDIFSASVSENVALIKSISQQYLQGVTGAVMRSITTGRGMNDLIPFLEKHKGITQRRARFIARDQMKKAYEGLNTGRMDRLGLDKYEWLHSGGSQHPRKLHIEMSGKVYSLKNPPIIDRERNIRGGPGDLPGCNCRKRIVLEFDN